jgi:phosphatidate cytidylyltransferase
MGGILIFLAIVTLIGWILEKRSRDELKSGAIQNLNARIKAWWIMTAIFAAALATGRTGLTVLFGFISFLALREFITLTPTHVGDHRSLFWIFFVITPLHYWLISRNWYSLYTIFIPVYAFLFIPLRSAIAGDCDQFLERAAKIQWGLMICVYCVSHAPALLYLDIPGYSGNSGTLLLYFVLVAQISDVMQYVWGKLFGRHKIAPNVSPNKTVEGFVGGTLSATALGAALWRFTPYNWWQAAAFSLLITWLGFAGGLVMSAIKRDRGVKDYGHLIEGHGGVMDRIDSLCFAAPVFFHVTRFFFT